MHAQRPTNPPTTMGKKIATKHRGKNPVATGNGAAAAVEAPVPPVLGIPQLEEWDEARPMFPSVGGPSDVECWYNRFDGRAVVKGMGVGSTPPGHAATLLSGLVAFTRITNRTQSKPFSTMEFATLRRFLFPEMVSNTATRQRVAMNINIRTRCKFLR